jgi:uncharacterized membrane protein
MVQRHAEDDVNELRTAVLLAATLTTGLTAGVFALYAHTVMPGLRTTDDRTFVAAFQALDRAIVNPWFMVAGFGGAAACSAAAVVLHLGRGPLPWAVAALVLYLVAVVVTVAVHLPLNDAIKAAGDVTTPGAATAVRDGFDEARWSAWNLVRVATSTVAFGCLAWALVVHGRTAPA